MIGNFLGRDKRTVNAAKTHSRSEAELRTDPRPYPDNSCVSKDPIAVGDMCSYRHVSELAEYKPNATAKSVYNNIIYKKNSCKDRNNKKFRIVTIRNFLGRDKWTRTTDPHLIRVVL